MADQADKLASSDPDYAIRDLYNAIAEGNFPTWSLNVQIMTFEEAEKFRYNPFDLTKVMSMKHNFYYYDFVFLEEFEDTKGVIRIHKSKDSQHNVQKKKDKSTNNDL